MSHNNHSTINPVTVSGWYKHTDGTIGYYRWHRGQLKREKVVASWADAEVADTFCREADYEFNLPE